MQQKPVCKVNFAPQTLLKLGADNLNAVDKNGNTAMMSASFKGNMEIVKLLHGAKANLNQCSQAGTVMHSAAEGGHMTMLEVTHYTAAFG